MQDLDKLKLKDKKYIIFDMDGTLIDSIGVWNITDQKLIEEYAGITIDLDTIQLERDSFLHSNQDSDIYVAYCEYLIKKYGLSIKTAEQLLNIRWDISNKVLATEMDFKPDVVELISKLKGLGFTLALATMTTQVQLDVYSHKNIKMRKQMNIEEVFDFITTKDDVIRKKPDPEIYNLIIEHYHARPDECLIFEDSYTGVLASKNAGIEVVNVYDKYADLDRDKINAITDYNIANYRQFIDYLERIYSNPEGDIAMKEIDKIAFIYLKNGKILSTLSKGKDAYYIPGGKREGSETDEETLIRECKEELTIDILKDTIKYYGTFKAQAHGKAEGIIVKMTCYIADFKGTLKPSSEIEEIKWLDYSNLSVKISPVDELIFKDLYDKHLID